MIQKPWSLLAALCVLFAIFGATEAQVGESPEAANREPLKKRWALMLKAPGGDPVEVSQWRFRKTCEIERASMVRTALRRGVPISGTRCVALSWTIWFRYHLRTTEELEEYQEEAADRAFQELEEYLEEAAGRAAQEDVASEFGMSWKSTFVRELRTAGETVWAYEANFRIISIDGKPITPPYVLCFVLTFDKDKILREWRKERRQGDCFGPAAPSFTSKDVVIEDRIGRFQIERIK